MARNPDRRLSLPLAVAALTTIVVAVAMDVLADEHPTHTLVVGLAAVVVAAARMRLAGRFDGVLASVSGALVAQPALHAASHHADAHSESSAEGVVGVAASHGPSSMLQILLPALVVLAVTFCSRIVELLILAARRIRPQRRSLPHLTESRSALAPAAAHTARIGSMLRWCGWALQTARRGPPSRWPSPVHLAFSVRTIS